MNADPYFQSFLFSVVALLMWLVGASLSSIFTVALVFACDFLARVVLEILPHYKMTRVLTTPWNQRDITKDAIAFVECMRCYGKFSIQVSSNANILYEFRYPTSNPTKKMTLSTTGMLRFNDNNMLNTSIYSLSRFSDLDALVERLM